MKASIYLLHEEEEMRGLVAFVLGVLSFPLFFFLGEGAGVPVMVPGMTAYFFICQFMLSRGRVNGYREWPIMLAWMLFQCCCC